MDLYPSTPKTHPVILTLQMLNQEIQQLEVTVLLKVTSQFWWEAPSLSSAGSQVGWCGGPRGQSPWPGISYGVTLGFLYFTSIVSTGRRNTHAIWGRQWKHLTDQLTALHA